ncbi:MAG: suppressor of tub2 mutation [Trizodia sp. TS-e1964]|nr:MAG: suppressor of tub2 mutation [Trizodia sp. TS-e1964]
MFRFILSSLTPTRLINWILATILAIITDIWTQVFNRLMDTAEEYLPTTVMASIITAVTDDYLDFTSVREMEIKFQELLQPFEGKETEANWQRREKNCRTLARMNKGNGPRDFPLQYVAGIRTLLDGILKAINSLRTSLSKEGCTLIQEVAQRIGAGFDPMVDIVLPNLIKLCAGTKKINSQNGNIAIDIILNNVTYHLRLTQHIWTACQDKNVQPRLYAASWLETLIEKHSHAKTHIDHSGGTEYIERCIKKGITDPNPGVREAMRKTYWTFEKHWPARAAIILNGLSGATGRLLKMSNNVAKIPQQSLMSTPIGAIGSTADTAATAQAPRPATTRAPRMTLKEQIAAHRKALEVSGKIAIAAPAVAIPAAAPQNPTIPPAANDNQLLPPPQPVAVNQLVAANNPVPANPVNPANQAVNNGLLQAPVRRQPRQAQAGRPAPNRVTANMPAARPIAIPSQHNRIRSKSPAAPRSPPRRLITGTSPPEIAPPRMSPPERYITENGRQVTETANGLDLASGILIQGTKNLRRNTIDADSLRVISETIKNFEDVLDDTKLIVLLLLELLNYLESPTGLPNVIESPCSTLDIRSQALSVVRSVLVYKRTTFAPFYEYALCSLLYATQHFHQKVHISDTLNKTIEDIAVHGKPNDCIDALLDMIEKDEETGVVSIGSTLKSLQYLSHFLHSLKIKRGYLTDDEGVKLSKNIIFLMGYEDVTLRKAVIGVCIELYVLVGAAKFWTLMNPLTETEANFASYMLARNAGAANRP